MYILCVYIYTYIKYCVCILLTFWDMYYCLVGQRFFKNPD